MALQYTVYTPFEEEMRDIYIRIKRNGEENKGFLRRRSLFFAFLCSTLSSSSNKHNRPEKPLKTTIVTTKEHLLPPVPHVAVPPRTFSLTCSMNFSSSH